jgi:replicative DNA helicase
MAKEKAVEAPNSKESEMMALGSMLNDTNSLNIGVKRFEASDFFQAEHQIIFHALKKLHKEGKPADIHLLAEELKKHGELKRIGGIAYLTTLAQYAGTATYIEEYINRVKDKARLRKLIDVAQRAQQKALEEPDDVHSFIASVHEDFEILKQNQARDDSLYGHLLEPASEEKIREEIKNISPGARVGMMLGDVDLRLPGGALTIVAGATGHGKTLLMINMILNYLSLEENKDKKVWFFSYEESRAAILSLFMNTFINEEISENNRRTIKSYFRDGHPQYVKKMDKELFLNKKDEFFKTLVENGRLNIFYCDHDIEKLDRGLRFLKNKSDVGLIAIDYMQLLRHSSIKTTQRHEELKHICQVAKDCAVDTGLPILLAAQFNRTVVNEQAVNKLAIGEAGDIERSANMIIGLWNRSENESSAVANIGRGGTPIPKDTAMYLELLKSREEGIGHSRVFRLNGNTGKLTSKKIEEFG